MTQEDSPKNNQIDDMQKILNMKRKTSSSTKWAMGLTGVWAAVVLILGYMKWPQLVSMPPNEWGDFLAGTFSPLALLWLVAGYRQQGDELFLNTKALLMQQVEMKNQVEEFKKLALHSGEQVKISKAERFAREEADIWSRQPIFSLVHADVYAESDLLFTISNEGVEGYDVLITSADFHDCNWKPSYAFENGEVYNLLFKGLMPGSSVDDFNIDISYVDKAGMKMLQKFRLKVGRAFKPTIHQLP